MSKLSTELWNKIDQGVWYKAEIHCPLILEIFENGGSMSEFCLETGASRTRIGVWLREYEEFFEALSLAKELGMQNWLKMGEENLTVKGFNVMVWKAMGKKIFGNPDKISLKLTPKALPCEHYAEIMHQAACGDFTAGELKQVMEAVNVGLRAYEVNELQKEIDDLQSGLKKMQEREFEHQITNKPTEKDNQAAVASSDGEAVCSKK